MNEEKKSSFKVVDRRRFTDDGDERAGPDVPTEDKVRVDKVEASRKETTTPEKAAPVNDGTSEAPSTPKQKAPANPNALTFSMFLQSLAQQALMQMGLIPWPHGQRELALEQARDTIDIVELLKDKTVNNLSPEEKQLMDTVVYELKVSFVEVQQAIARQRAGIKPAAPGMPGMPGMPPGMPR